MAGLMRGPSARCRAHRILCQQAPASVSERRFSCILRSAAFNLVMNYSKNRALSLWCTLAFGSKLGSGKRNVTTTCPRGAQQGGRHMWSTTSSLLHKCLHVFYTWWPPCWLLSLSAQLYKYDNYCINFRFQPSSEARHLVFHDWFTCTRQSASRKPS